MDMVKASVYHCPMNDLVRHRPLSTLRRPADKIFAMGFAVLLAAAMGSCDSDESLPTVNLSPAPPGPTTMETDTSGGEAVAMSQPELSYEYGTLSGLLAEAASAKVWKQFRAQQQVEISVSGNRLVVTATGDDPVLIMPRFAAGQKFIIEAVIESQNDTSAQLYYLTPGQSKYRDDQSQVVELKAGRNVVYFKIDDPNVIDPLRFDPAAKPGTYTIERMTARLLAPAGNR